jgi:hypothetical protein
MGISLLVLTFSLSYASFTHCSLKLLGNAYPMLGRVVHRQFVFFRSDLESEKGSEP